MEHEALLDRIDDGFLALDESWRFTYVNDRAGELLGRDDEDLVSAHIWEEFPEATDTEFYDRYHEAIETQQPVHFEAYYEPLETWYSVHAYPSETGLSVFFRDITERRRREEELARQTARLERFASILSHDLNNPLGVARGNAELLADVLDDVDDPAAEMARSNVESIREAHARMDEILDSVLTLARKGDTVDTPASVSLETVASDAWGLTETAGASLVVESDATIEADPERLELVFSNLFRNSVEHGSTGNRPAADDSVEHGSTGSRTSSGDSAEETSASNRTSEKSDDSVEHGSTGSRPEGDENRDQDGRTRAAADLTVRVGTTGDGFYVADDGPGIPAEDREHVFEYGYTTSDDGTGFGLAIVEEIADAHGWTVAVTDSDDGGARFEFGGVTVGA